LFEVKASKKKDRRGRKQKRHLERLHEFFETDMAAELRGFANVARKAAESPEQTYVTEIDACIAEAMKNGHALRSPERGLHYLVMMTKGQDVDEAMRPRAWAPYVLSLLLSRTQTICGNS
jgi:hypothetical protein